MLVALLCTSRSHAVSLEITLLVQGTLSTMAAGDTSHTTPVYVTHSVGRSKGLSVV